MIQMIMQAYIPSLYENLGLFIPLIVVNCIILARAESFASKNPVLPSAVDGIAMGAGFTCALTVLATVRELIGAGTLLGFRIMPAFYEPAIIFILPSGAFLTLGMLIALMNKIMDVRKQRALRKAMIAAGLPIAPEPEIHLTEEEILVPLPDDKPEEKAEKESKSDKEAEAVAAAPEKSEGKGEA